MGAVSSILAPRPTESGETAGGQVTISAGSTVLLS